MAQLHRLTADTTTAYHDVPPGGASTDIFGVATPSTFQNPIRWPARIVTPTRDVFVRSATLHDRAGTPTVESER